MGRRLQPFPAAFTARVPPADYAGIIAVTGFNTAQDESFGLAPIAQAALFVVVEIAAVLVAAG